MIFFTILGGLFFGGFIIGLLTFMIRLFIMACFPSFDKKLDDKGM
jgi:hypothetical protein